MTRLACLLAGATALALLLNSSSPARAAENGGSVTGKVELAPAEKRGESPERGMGFVPRAKNAIKPPRPHNPLPLCVVVLEKGPVDDEDRKATRPAIYEFIGEGFSVPLLPVLVGSKVELSNKSRRSPRLYSKAAPDAIPGDPINPKGVRPTEAIAEAHKLIDLRDQDSVHTVGHIVAFEHPYFAIPNPETGLFTIEGVPPGDWSLKVWYRDGWVKMPDSTVAVQSKKVTKSISVTLPTPLETVDNK